MRNTFFYKNYKDFIRLKYVLMIYVIMKCIYNFYIRIGIFHILTTIKKHKNNNRPLAKTNKIEILLREGN